MSSDNTNVIGVVGWSYYGANWRMPRWTIVGAKHQKKLIGFSGNWFSAIIHSAIIVNLQTETGLSIINKVNIYSTMMKHRNHTITSLFIVSCPICELYETMVTRVRQLITKCGDICRNIAISMTYLKHLCDVIWELWCLKSSEIGLLFNTSFKLITKQKQQKKFALVVL